MTTFRNLCLACQRGEPREDGMYRFIDCQGFAGGFTLGAARAGLELVGKRELPGGFGAQSCLHNRHLLGNFPYQESPWEEWEPLDAEIVLGNPPCSGFSLLSSQHFRGKDSPVNSCMWALIRYAARVKPEFVVFESVQAAYTQGAELMRELRDELEKRTGQRYKLTHVKQNAYALGGAALRKRYFFVAHRPPFGIESPKVGTLPLLKDVIGDLEDLDPTRREPQPYVHEPSWWSAEKRSPDGYVDGHVCMENTHASRVHETLHGGDWEQGEGHDRALRRFYEKTGKLPNSYNEQQQARVLKRDFDLGFNQPHRWRYDRASRVVTGNLGGIVHPTEPRLITLREAYRIQGFPDNWRLQDALEEVSLSQASNWPGKGIPVEAGEWIADWIRHALEGTPGEWAGMKVGDREYLIDVTHDWQVAYNERTGEFVDSMPKHRRRELEERPA